MFVNPTRAYQLERACAWRAADYARARGMLNPEVECLVESFGGGDLIYAGAGAPVNRAIGLGFIGLFNETDLAYVETFYSNRGVPARLDLCPLASPSMLERLRASGYRVEGFYSVLYRAIAAVPPVPPGSVLVTPAGPAEADLWLKTVAEGFSGQDPPSQEVIDMITPTFYSASALNFLAYLDDEPVGGGALVLHEGIAELCSASTRPAFRQRGVQTALLRARLESAQQAGADWAMIITAPGSASQRNAERSGFQLAYTKAVMVTAGIH